MRCSVRPQTRSVCLTFDSDENLADFRNAWIHDSEICTLSGLPVKAKSMVFALTSFLSRGESFLIILGAFRGGRGQATRYTFVPPVEES